MTADPIIPFIPRFILDTPAEQDALNGHDRLATTIADALVGDERIKFVGILGEWGSGKSTVVGMLARKLETDPRRQILCFNYDAWLHQSDPPKRSFLEALMRYVRDETALADLAPSVRAWDTEFKTLHKQVEFSQVKTKPQLGISTKLILPALALVPIGLKLIGDGVLSPTAQHDPAAIIAYAAGWFLTLGPVLVGGMLYLSWRPWGDKRYPLRGRPRAALFWRRHRKRYRDQSILAVFVNRPAEYKHEQKIKGPEPSTIEFQDVFRKIVAEIQRQDRRLVIIIDNLDRVPDPDRLALWSTIRSFFLGSDHAGRPLTREQLPAVILPIDTSALDRLSGMEAAGRADLVKPSGRPGQAFSDKTFDLVFHVPPPVLSRWHAYLGRQLAEAFGDHLRQEWLHAIPALYEAFARRDMMTPGLTPRITPRSLNVFVNAIATRWMQWRALDVPLETIAYFVLAQIENQNDLNQALGDPATTQIQQFDPDWQLGVAALYYGVAKPEAQELFMQQPIRDAIREHDSESFQTLAQRPGFERYFFNVLQGAGTAPDGVDSQRAASLLAELATKVTGPWTQQAWRILALATSSSIASFPLRVEGLAALFDALDQTHQRFLFNEIQRALSGLQVDLVQGQIEAFKAAILLLRARADHLGLSPTPVLAPSIVIFLDFLMGPDADQLEAWITIGDTREAGNAAIGFLTDRLNTVDLDENIAPMIEALANRTSLPFAWSPLLAVAADIAKSQNAAWTARALRVLWALDRIEPATRSVLQQLVDNGFLRQALDLFVPNGLAADLPIGVAIAWQVGALLPNWSFSQLVLDFPELGVEVARLIGERGELRIGDFLSRFHQYPQEAPLLRASFTAWLEAHPPTPDEVAQLIDEHATYVQMIEENARARFWHELEQSDGFHDALAHRDLSVFVAVAGPILAYEAEHPGQRTKSGRAQMVAAAEKRLNAISTPGWIQALESGSDAYALISLIAAARIPANLASVLADFAATAISSADVVHRMRWFEIAQRMTTGERNAALKGMKAALLTAPIDHFDELFDMSNGLLLRAYVSPKDADDLVGTVGRMVDSHRGRAWIDTHRADIGNWIAIASDAAQERLLERQRALLDREGIDFELPSIAP